MNNIKHSLYEEALAKYLISDSLQAFSFWKGRVALYAILRALDIQPGDEVILPGYTCVVVPNAVRLCGAKPVYVDINPIDYSLDPTLLEGAITDKTRAILLQHTYGIPGPIEAVMSIATDHNLYVIEDACHALGTRLDEKMLGTLADAAFFSSQWSKPYTSGLGGMAVTKNPEIAENIQKMKVNFSLPGFGAQAKLAVQYALFSAFYSPRLFWFAQGLLRKLSALGLFVGSSSAAELEGLAPQDHEWIMCAFQERVGLQQLRKYQKNLDDRKALMNFYRDGLAKAGVHQLNYSDETILLRYPLRVKNKWALLEKAQAARVELGDWFVSPLHPIELVDHAKFAFTLGQCPISEQAAEEVINMPLHQWMTLAEAERTLEFVIKEGVF